MAINCNIQQSGESLGVRLKSLMDKAFEDKTIEDGEMEGFFEAVAGSINEQKVCGDDEDRSKRFYTLANRAYTMYVEAEAKLPQTLEIVRRSPVFGDGLRTIVKEAEDDLRFPMTYPEGFLKPNWDRLTASLSAGFMLGGTVSYLAGRFLLRQATATLARSFAFGGPLGLVVAGGVFLWNLSSNMAEAATLKIPSAKDPKESIGLV